MAKIEDLVKRISDEKLRDEIAAEVRELKKHKQFGLVFEEHLPEMLRLPKVAIRVGNLVVQRDAPGNDLWRVIGIKGKKATCRQPITPGKYDGEKRAEFPLGDLVLVVSFGEPIYPVMTPVDRVMRGGPDKPSHILINGDNFHALQLLLYAYERKVDVIYVDPPYNTGARDWKYNNNYVDKTDAWRHSKWLSMMKKRMKLAKRLLKTDGVLIVTIDVNELHHVSLLLKELFPEFLRYMVSIVTNPAGVSEFNFARVEEQALFFCPNIGRDLVLGNPIDLLPSHGDLHVDELEPQPEENDGLLALNEKAQGDSRNIYEFQLIRRRGTESRREDRPSMFYPVYVDEKKKHVVSAGGAIPIGEEPSMRLVKGLRPVWPINKSGMHGRWQIGSDTMQTLIESGDIVLGTYNKKEDSWTINRRVLRKVAKKLKTVWRHKSHDAGTHGTVLLSAILGERRAFSFPKSVYAVRDCIAPIVRDRPTAIIVDFFAGSGTTFHATALINGEDEGCRQCILVTNNEVEEGHAKTLRSGGYHPGDPEFEKHGIAENVTWPRCKYVIQGHRDDATDLPGRYLSGREMRHGFEENMEYLRLDFVDPAQVERGDAFERILPILWMMAGAIGERELRRGSSPWYLAKHSPFAVLIQESKFNEFEEKLRQRKGITHIFLVTNSEDNFAFMRHELGRKYHCFQLYKSYLDNFRINTVDRHAAGREPR